MHFDRCKWYTECTCCRMFGLLRVLVSQSARLKTASAHLSNSQSILVSTSLNIPHYSSESLCLKCKIIHFHHF